VTITTLGTAWKAWPLAAGHPLQKGGRTVEGAAKVKKRVERRLSGRKDRILTFYNDGKQGPVLGMPATAKRKERWRRASQNADSMSVGKGEHVGHECEGIARTSIQKRRYELSSVFECDVGRKRVAYRGNLLLEGTGNRKWWLPVKRRAGCP